jgi:thiol-disulfide isomerase/thioredoxin
MIKKIILLVLCTFSFAANAQKGYEISVSIKNCPDTLAFLTFYQFDKTLIKDTCKTIKNGKIVFKGKTKLDKGIYSIVSQQKSIYFDFFIDDETQKIEINTEYGADLVKKLNSPTSKLQNDFFDYIRYINKEGSEFQLWKQNLNAKTKKDSLQIFEKQKEFETKIQLVEEDFISKNKGSFIADVINLKMEKTLKNPPKASNGRTDSIAVFKYYKKHFWDNVNFKDAGIFKNPFFHPKIKKYLDHVAYPHPDTLTVEVDKIINQTEPGSTLNKLLIAHITYTYESTKLMGFDKVFVHMSDKYFKTGKAKGIYQDDSVIEKIIKRAERLKPIMVGNIAPELAMIDIKNGPRIKQMGFETATTSEEVTKVFYDNYNELNKMFVKLHDVKADYTILIFWDVDCGHCQKEIPVLRDVYHELLNEKKDVKVYSVYTLFDSEKYKKYIDEHKLDFINVYDGPHFNNVVEKYDVYSTPVIYLLDKDKRIKAKRIGVDQIKSILKALEEEAKSKKS